MTWFVQDTEAGVVITPDDDIILHKIHESGCPCAPTVTREGSTCCGSLYVREITTHHAMDGRPD